MTELYTEDEIMGNLTISNLVGIDVVVDRKLCQSRVYMPTRLLYAFGHGLYELVYLDLPELDLRGKVKENRAK